MWGMKLAKLSAWDVAYAIDMAIACLITSWVMIFLLPGLVGWHRTSVGVLWAVISTVFVYKDSRTHSLSAGISRLIATFAGFALCPEADLAPMLPEARCGLENKFVEHVVLCGPPFDWVSAEPLRLWLELTM